MLGRAFGTSPQNWPRGQPGHVGQIPLSDWSKFQILCTDWSGAKPTHCTTVFGSWKRDNGFENILK